MKYLVSALIFFSIVFHLQASLLVAGKQVFRIKEGAYFYDHRGKKLEFIGHNKVINKDDSRRPKGPLIPVLGAENNRFIDLRDTLHRRPDSKKQLGGLYLSKRIRNFDYVYKGKSQKRIAELKAIINLLMILEKEHDTQSDFTSALEEKFLEDD